MHRHTSRRVRPGFTMIELLTVVGIIVVLIAILLPVVASVQRKAREADTSQEINRLATAAQNYYNDYRAYPGPAADRELSGFTGANPKPLTITGTGGVLTASENFTLGLLGGVVNIGTNQSPALQFQSQLVGKGPQSLNTLSPKQATPYTDFNATELTPLVGGNYVTYNSIAISQPSMSGTPPKSTPIPKPTVLDSQVPEFFDHFTTPGPLIYLRARVGARSIVDAIPTNPSGVVDPQYYSAEMAPYGFDYNRPVGNDPDTGTPKYPMPIDFFKHPTINDTMTPRNSGTFILMSAGADGIWGTKDDIIYSN
jgi:prepilin-type N-terminal cleavage/methylation domain-containing protein